MFFAAEVAESGPVFNGFDVFLVLFTLALLFALFRLIKAPQKNVFAIAFALVSLIVFLIMDFVMVKGWLGLL